MGNIHVVCIVCTLFMIFWLSVDATRIKIKLPKRDRNSKDQPYRIGTYKVTWYKAEEICRDLNMRLATIKGEQAAERIDQSLEDAADDMRSSVVGQFWTSGNDLAELGNFFWMSTGEEITRYTNWMRRAPTKEERSYKNWQISPHCIYLSKQKSKYRWDYGPCSQKRYFICERTDTM